MPDQHGRSGETLDLEAVTVVNVMAPVHTGVPSAPTGNRSETLLQSQPMLFSLHEGKAPPSSTSFFRKLAILGTCAAGAVAAALAAAAGGSDSKLGASTSRLCGAALSALGGAALTVSASDLFPSGPLWRLDNGRRKRAASVTRPSMQVSQLSEETITLATILLQQASDEAEEGSPNAPHTNQSNHVSGRQASEFPDTTEALENRLFELLEGYSLQHLQVKATDWAVVESFKLSIGCNRYPVSWVGVSFRISARGDKRQSDIGRPACPVNIPNALFSPPNHSLRVLLPNHLVLF